MQINWGSDKGRAAAMSGDDAAEFEPGDLMKFLQENAGIISYLTKSKEGHILVLPNDIERIKRNLDDHIEDYLFERIDASKLRRPWDDLTVDIKEYLRDLYFVNFIVVEKTMF